MAKFRHFGKNLHVLSKIFKVYFLFGTMLSILWQNFDIIVVNGQILKNNLTIWSHCPVDPFNWPFKDSPQQLSTWEKEGSIGPICKLTRSKAEQIIFLVGYNDAAYSSNTVGCTYYLCAVVKISLLICCLFIGKKIQLTRTRRLPIAELL